MRGLREGSVAELHLSEIAGRAQAFLGAGPGQAALERGSHGHRGRSQSSTALDLIDVGVSTGVTQACGTEDSLAVELRTISPSEYSESRATGEGWIAPPGHKALSSLAETSRSMHLQDKLLTVFSFPTFLFRTTNLPILADLLF